MPQSLSGAYLHLVFSTKGRRAYLRDPSLRIRLHSHLGAISDRLGCSCLAVGGVEDHVHLLARFGKVWSQADWVKEIKRVSCQWLRDQPEDLQEFAWQGGYATFSVSGSQRETVTHYIQRQEEHHRKRSFQEELRILLTNHRVDWDERYLWD